jgi:hypothetical protein
MSLMPHDLSHQLVSVRREIVALTPSLAPPATRTLSSAPSLYLAASSAISWRSWNRFSGPTVGSCTHSMSWFSLD